MTLPLVHEPQTGKPMKITATPLKIEVVLKDLESCSCEGDAKSFRREILEEVDINKLLDKFGPEGLFVLADELRSAALEDMRAAIEDN